MASISNVKLPNNVSYTVRSNANTYGVCGTAANTSNKLVNNTSPNSINGTFELMNGARITVTFNNANTADNPKLNVNSSGNIDIKFNGSVIGTDEKKNLIKGVCDFVYDGNAWNLISNNIDYSYIQTAAISGSIAAYNFWFGTQAAYDLIQTKDPNTFYFINE